MAQAQNPFEAEFQTPHNTPPFSKITNKNMEEAIDRGIRLEDEAIDAIVKQRSRPTFENTIVALEDAGKELSRVLNVFFPLESANSDDELMEISMRVSAKLSKHSTDIVLNEPLWQRIKQVWDNRDNEDLDTEDRMLLKRTYESFEQSGANLQGEDREKYRKISAELSELTTKFGQNVLKEMATYKIWLGKDGLAGLPESSVEAAALAAKAEGREGEYLFTLAQPTYMAFMKYSARPDLREKMYRLNAGRNMKGEYSNVEILARIADLRRQMANLFGYKTYADYKLVNTMAETPANVYRLLDQLREAYRPAEQAEMRELTEFASRLEGKPVTINPWDYSYYSNKLKNEKYSYNEEEMRPYFELNNVIDGVFGLATKLYGLNFTYNPDIEVYHPEVKAYEVTDSAGEYVGIIYTDFFPRDTKSPGAWMTGFRDQSISPDGTNNRPQVSITMNFTKPTDSKPSLLTPYEVETFLHEFGHGLHGLLTKAKYGSLSGTNVLHDFVELPSQFNENYLTEKEFLDGFARHYETGDSIPAELVDRLIASAQFGAAYACLRQLSFGLLDMAWHTITEPVDDAAKFENDAIESVAMFEPIEGLQFAPTFSHIFAGGYAAGYYGYKWAEVLDADAFAHFKEHGIFDRETADSFRDNILSRGGTEDPAVLYRRFRGHDATIDALLKRDGITPETTISDVRKKD